MELESPKGFWSIAAAGVFSTSVLGAVVKGIFDMLGRRAKGKAGKAIETATKVYVALNDAEFRMDANRILVNAAHNCGGPIRPDVVLSSTALYEVVSGVEPRLERLANVRLDQYFVGLLSSVVQSDVVWVNTSEIPEKTNLHNLYTLDGIERACLFLIRVDGTRILYGCVHFTSAQANTPKIDEAVQTLRRTLADLLK